MSLVEHGFNRRQLDTHRTDACHGVIAVGRHGRLKPVVTELGAAATRVPGGSERVRLGFDYRPGMFIVRCGTLFDILNKVSIQFVPRATAVWSASPRNWL